MARYLVWNKDDGRSTARLMETFSASDAARQKAESDYSRDGEISGPADYVVEDAQGRQVIVQVSVLMEPVFTTGPAREIPDAERITFDDD